MRKATILVLIAGLFALACGPAAQQQPQAASNQPKPGGFLNVTIETDPFDWDITYVGKSDPNKTGIGLSYLSLLKFKSGPEVEYVENVLQPELAERWTVSPDAKTFTFNLRKDVKYPAAPPFNGRDLTSADVKWTMDYRMRFGEFKSLPVDQAGFLLEGLERVDTPDPYTAVIHFKTPFAPFLNYAASRWNPILPKEIYEQDGHFKDKIAGPGPYNLDTNASQNGTRLVWKKNPTHYNAGNIYLDEIRWIVLPSESSAFAAFQTKQLDIVEALVYHPYTDVTKGSPQAESYKYYATNAQQIHLSQAKKGPQNDVRVRRALAMSFDRDELSRILAGGQALWAIPGAQANEYSEAETKRLVKQDVEAAKRLMAEAGYASGFELEWPYPSTESQGNITMYQLIQAQARRIGVNIVLKPMDLAEQRAKRRRGDFDVDASIGGTGQLNSDVDSMLFGKYHSTASGNNPKIKDPELDKLLEAQRQESNEGKRAEIFKKITVLLLDQWWSLDTIYIPRWYVWHPHVKNFRPHYTDSPSYRFAWVER